MEKPPYAIKSIEILNQLKDFLNFSKIIELEEGIENQVRKAANEKIGQDEETIKKRLSGLSKEDEFVLVSLLLGNALQVTRLSQQKITSDSSYQIPDFLVSVRVPKILDKDQDKAQRFFVEVKKLP